MCLRARWRACLAKQHGFRGGMLEQHLLMFLMGAALILTAFGFGTRPNLRLNGAAVAVRRAGCSCLAGVMRQVP